MADLTTNHYVILGMLTSRDWSAYALAEQVGRGLADVWSRADRQRYDAPKRLVEEGLVTATIEPSGKRTRTVYSITDTGRAALAEWLTHVPRPMSMEFEGLMRVLVADQGTLDDLRQDLTAIAEHARAGLERYAGHAEFILATGGTFPERQHTFALANRFMTGHYTHLIEWATWALTEIETWEDTVVPATTHADRTRAIFEAAPRLTSS